MGDEKGDSKISIQSNGSWKDGPVGTKRRCTDFLFFLLIITSWVAMTFVGAVATGIIDSPRLIVKGNPSVLFGGMDYQGNICGQTDAPTVNGENTIELPFAYPLGSGISVCVEECPSLTDLDQFHCKYETQKIINEQAGNSTSAQLMYLSYTVTKDCMPHVSSTAYLGYCSPDVISDVITAQLNDQFNVTVDGGVETGTFFDEAAADVYFARSIILAFGIGGSVFLGFLFLILMKVPAFLSFFIWSIIIGITVGFSFGGHLLYTTSERWGEEGLKEEREIKALYWLSILCFSCAGIWTFVILFIRKRISLAIACVREASAAVTRMPIMIFFPFLQVMGFVAYLIPWLVYVVYLASSGEVEAACMCPNNFFESGITASMEVTEGECGDGCFQYKSFVYSRDTKYAGLYMLFNLFWTSQFIIAMGQICIATAICMWYFSRDKKLVRNGTFFRAIGLATFYHTGTAAFGSLIIAIVRTIRSVVVYLEQKSKRAPDNRMVKAIFKCLRCCLCIADRCLKFISKNAYVQVAMNGYSFCIGAKEAFILIITNAVRISAVTVIGEAILFSMKAFICLFTSIAGYIYLDYYYEDQLHGLYVVTIIIFVISLCIAEMFQQVIFMAISTMIQCFVTDEKMFEPGDRYASGSLAKMIDSTQQATVSVHPGETKGDTSIQKGRRASGQDKR